MRLAGLIAAGVMALSSGAGAMAQTAAPPSPEKLALAHRLFELSGGEKQMRLTINALYGAMFGSLDKALPAEQQRFASLIRNDLQAGVVSLIPTFVDSGARVYAQDLSERELSDYIAFQQSDSGRAIIAKAPTIMRDTMASIIPVVTAAMPAIMQKVVVDVCSEAKCTDKDRQVIADAMTKTMQRRQS